MNKITMRGSGLKVEAKTYLEVQVDLAGTFQPGCAAWGGGRFERPTNPPEADSIEDVEILRLCGVQKVMAPIETRGSSFWDTKLVDLLDGVEASARAKIMENVLRFLDGDAERELLAQVEWEER